jgi:hypothetical protein
MVRSLLILSLTLPACKALPDAEEAYSDALVTAFRDLHADEEAVAATLRSVERQTYQLVDVVAPDVAARAVGPAPLTEADVADLERPDVDPGQALAVAVAGVSPFAIEAHATIPTLEDQRPVEPQSPDHYERTFLDGRECWEDRGCPVLKTHQELTKKNLLLEVPYEFFKDFRWIDLAAGTDEEEPRWAYIAKSWNPDSFEGEGGKNTLVQSYTVEFWIPRDGRGFRWDDPEVEPVEGRAEDSTGGGVLRLLCLWTETDLSIAASDELTIGTIRWGIDQNYEAVDEFLTAQAATD